MEDRLGIEAHAHGNVVILSGSEAACEIARESSRTALRTRDAGSMPGPGDFDGLIRHARLQDAPSPDRAGADRDAAQASSRRARRRRRILFARWKRTDLVFGIGPAGTGKTYLARGARRRSCLERGLVERIILSRPAVEAGERLGFLPGDMRGKVDPYLRPLYDALYDVLPPEKVETRSRARA